MSRSSCKKYSFSLLQRVCPLPLSLITKNEFTQITISNVFFQKSPEWSIMKVQQILNLGADATEIRHLLKTEKKTAGFESDRLLESFEVPPMRKREKKVTYQVGSLITHKVCFLLFLFNLFLLYILPISLLSCFATLSLILSIQKYGYYGVIYDYDDSCQAGLEWINQMRVNKLPKGTAQPFYHVYVDTRFRFVLTC